MTARSCLSSRLRRARYISRERERRDLPRPHQLGQLAHGGEGELLERSSAHADVAAASLIRVGAARAAAPRPAARGRTRTPARRRSAGSTLCSASICLRWSFSPSSISALCSSAISTPATAAASSIMLLRDRGLALRQRPKDARGKASTSARRPNRRRGTRGGRAKEGGSWGGIVRMQLRGTAARWPLCSLPSTLGRGIG